MDCSSAIRQHPHSASISFGCREVKPVDVFFSCKDKFDQISSRPVSDGVGSILDNGGCSSNSIDIEIVKVPSLFGGITVTLKLCAIVGKNNAAVDEGFRILAFEMVGLQQPPYIGGLCGTGGDVVFGAVDTWHILIRTC